MEVEKIIAQVLLNELRNHIKRAIGLDISGLRKKEHVIHLVSDKLRSQNVGEERIVAILPLLDCMIEEIYSHLSFRKVRKFLAKMSCH